jgi:hypothetical protein
VSAAYRIGAPHAHGDSVRIPSVWLAFGVSVLLHALLLWSGWMPQITPLTLEDALKGKTQGSLSVRIVPPVRPVPPVPPAPSPPEARPPPALKPLAVPPGKATAKSPKVPQVPQAPQVLARESAAATAALPKPAPEPPRAAAPPAPGDLAAYIEARRRGREPEARPAPPAKAAPAETAQERDNRIAAERLGLNRTPAFDGGERKTGGGIFQVARVTRDEAEFFFYGWNKQIRRNARQMIEVRRGDNPTIELAVVRRMIAIIRDYTTGDFVWESQRLGREVTLSASPADNAGLEDFMMREFFVDERGRPR